MLGDYLVFVNRQAEDYTSNGYSVTEVMMLYNYTLVVEPIIWFRWSNNTYQKASVGFTVDWEGTVTTAHKDEKWEWRKMGLQQMPAQKEQAM